MGEIYVANDVIARIWNAGVALLIRLLGLVMRGGMEMEWLD